MTNFCRIMLFPGREVCTLYYTSWEYIENLEKVWKSGSKIWKFKKSGTVGRPTVPDFSRKSKSRPRKKLELLNLESGTTFFAKKGKKARKIELWQPPTLFHSFTQRLSAKVKQGGYAMVDK